MFFFFFSSRRRHTRLTCDWSSDVCSSDLGLVLATMMKLKQVCNHPAHFLADGSSLPGRSGKLNRLTEVLQEAVSEGDRALVFTQFTEMGILLERHLQRHLGCEVLWLHGGVP